MCLGDSPYEEDITLYYDIEENVMVDEDGWHVHWIYSIITPNDLYLFKTKKEDMVVKGVRGDVVVLIYPDSDEII